MRGTPARTHEHNIQLPAPHCTACTKAVAGTGQRRGLGNWDGSKREEEGTAKYFNSVVAVVASGRAADHPAGELGGPEAAGGCGGRSKG